jgi:hypothetical protein
MLAAMHLPDHRHVPYVGLSTLPDAPTTTYNTHNPIMTLLLLLIDQNAL